MNQPPKVRIFAIKNNRELRLFCARMRFGASRELLTSSPIYAKGLQELEERFVKDYGPNAQKIFDDPRGGVVMLGPGLLVSAVASIDAFEEPKVWHLSISRVVGPPAPGRVDDGTALRFCLAFFNGPYTEGPPEGMFETVRHFRAPWTPN